MSVDNFETISFRVRKEDYREFQRVAEALAASGKIKQPKASVLAKTFLYVMTNQYKGLEEQAKAILANQSPPAAIPGGPQ